MLKILEAAEKVFAEKGFIETTISEIAKKANVSEATIYEYFGSKEELLFAIPKEKTIDHLKKNEELLEYMEGAVNKLKLLIHRHARLYEKNPDYAKVILLILKTNRNFLKSPAYKIVQTSARVIIQVLEEGIRNRDFKKDISPYLVRAMIYGTIEHLAIRKYLLGVPKDLLLTVDEIIRIIFNGILLPSKDTGFNINIKLEDNRNNRNRRNKKK